MNDLQLEQLFTELTPTQAAAVGGAAQFQESVDFDFFRSTQSFKVRPGGTISLSTDTNSDLNNPFFSASVRNVKTGRRTPAETLAVGGSFGRPPFFTRWTNMRGGTYKIDFVDTRDGINVRGNIDVIYDA